MTMRQIVWIVVLGWCAAILVAALVEVRDGALMDRCLLTHSSDTCHSVMQE